MSTQTATLVVELCTTSPDHDTTLKLLQLPAQRFLYYNSPADISSEYIRDQVVQPPPSLTSTSGNNDNIFIVYVDRDYYNAEVITAYTMWVNKLYQQQQQQQQDKMVEVGNIDRQYVLIDKLNLQLTLAYYLLDSKYLTIMTDVGVELWPKTRTALRQLTGALRYEVALHLPYTVIPEELLVDQEFINRWIGNNRARLVVTQDKFHMLNKVCDVQHKYNYDKETANSLVVETACWARESWTTNTQQECDLEVAYIEVGDKDSGDFRLLSRQEMRAGKTHGLSVKYYKSGAVYSVSEYDSNLSIGVIDTF